MVRGTLHLMVSAYSQPRTRMITSTPEWLNIHSIHYPCRHNGPTDGANQDHGSDASAVRFDATVFGSDDQTTHGESVCGVACAGYRTPHLGFCHEPGGHVRRPTVPLPAFC